MMNKNNNEKQNGTNEDICKSFRFMGQLPHPVLLVQKNRTIIDANEKARRLGVIAGIRCRDISPYPDKCTVWQTRPFHRESPENHSSGERYATYWVPLHSVENGLYLHFVMDVPMVIIMRGCGE